MGLPLRALGLAAGLAAVVATLVRRLHTLQLELEQAQAESSRQMKLRSEERAGRTKVERKLREQSRAPAAEASTAHSYSPIGYLTSCYVERRGTPRQGCLVPSARAQLKVSSQTVQAVAALDGLAQFSHVWLVYDFHQNTTTADKPQVRAKVHPPALGGAKLGLFATRTPHRPNAIGLTVARLLGVRGDTLLLGGADLVDGTPVRAALQSVRPSSPCLAGACTARLQPAYSPLAAQVLDVKPYLRHDIQPDASVPSWCEPVTASSLIREVHFAEAASAALGRCVPQLRLCEIALDPPHPSPNPNPNPISNPNPGADPNPNPSPNSNPHQV